MAATGPTTPVALVEEVYGRYPERVAVGRRRLGRPLTYAEWHDFDYRDFVTRGEAYVQDNFDRRAGTWQPLVMGDA